MGTAFGLQYHERAQIESNGEGQRNEHGRGHEESPHSEAPPALLPVVEREYDQRRGEEHGELGGEVPRLAEAGADPELLGPHVQVEEVRPPVLSAGLVLRNRL